MSTITMQSDTRPTPTLKELITRKDYVGVGYRVMGYTIMAPIIILCYIIVLPVLIVASLIGWLIVTVSGLLDKPNA